MAKAYSTTGYGKPTISLSLVAGGTLTANTTYYYRAMTSTHNTAGMDYCSAPSDVQSITTDTTNRSIKIDITHSTGNAEYTFIWVNEGTDPGTGNWGRADLYPNVYLLGTSSTNINASSASKITTLTDTGTRGTNNRLGASNYGIYILRETAQDQVTVTGGTALDPVTLEDIYQYAVTNSWDLNATINKVSYGPMGADFSDTYGMSSSSTSLGRATYLLNMKRLKIEDYWVVSNGDVINFSRYIGPATTTHYLTMGVYNSTYDFSSNGVNWTNVCHSSQFGTLYFHNAKIYDCRFRGRFLRSSITTAYANTFNLYASAGDSWKVIDSDVSGNFDRGMAIVSSTADCVIKRVRNYGNRWETNTTAGVLGTYTDWYLYPISASGPWLRTTAASDEYDVRNMRIQNAVGAGLGLYNSFDNTSNPAITKSRLINPYMNDWDRGYWFTSGGLGMRDDIAYVKRAYSVNAKLVDENGDVIEGVAVTCYDKDNNEVFSVNTDVNGLLPEQIVTYKEYRPSTTLTTPHNFPDGRISTYSPFRLVFTKTGYETYTLIHPLDNAIDMSIKLKKNRNVRISSNGALLAINPCDGSDSLLLQM